MKYILYTLLFFSIQFKILAQLVMPGDHPDPSVVKVGDTYWASATTSNWMPAYPILQSKDLIHWENKGFVFEKKPDWADYYFWAPEISYDKGKFHIYYSAHKKNGNLCLGIASANNAEGPYKDHGPLMCQEAGSIDAFPMRDDQGKLYLIWKEDGNSVNRPTPIWAMEMNEERTALTGEKKELFRNDTPWEGNLVEGVSMMKHGGYFYAFYAGAGCCGSACTYGIGVARAKNLLGPWEKYSKNPILNSSDEWKCPGHGTPIEKDGKHYFLFHAYYAKSNVFTGREGLLKEFTFTNDGWIAFQPQKVTTADLVPPAITNDFTQEKLESNWQWSVFQDVKYNLNNGSLTLQALPDPSGAFLAQKTYTSNYTAEVIISPQQSTAETGLAIIGDENNIIGASLTGNKLRVWGIRDKNFRQVSEKTVNTTDKITLKLTVRNARDITFSFSTDGKNFTSVTDKPIDGSFLPPWDRAVRVGLISKGDMSEKGVFENFLLRNEGR